MLSWMMLSWKHHDQRRQALAKQKFPPMIQYWAKNFNTMLCSKKGHEKSADQMRYFFCDFLCFVITSCHHNNSNFDNWNPQEALWVSNASKKYWKLFLQRALRNATTYSWCEKIFWLIDWKSSESIDQGYFRFLFFPMLLFRFQIRLLFSYLLESAKSYSLCITLAVLYMPSTFCNRQFRAR